VQGRKLELVALDDGGDPAQALSNTKKLAANQKVLPLTSYAGSPNPEQLRPVLDNAKLPLVGIANGTNSWRELRSQTIFHVRASYQDEADEIIRQLDAQQLNRIAIVYQEDADGLSGLAGARTAMARLAIRPEGIFGVHPGNPDVRQMAASVTAANPQAVVLLVSAAVAGEIVRQIHALGAYPQFIILSSVAADDNFRQTLGNSVRGVGASQVVPYPWSSATEAVREYLAALKLSGGTPSYLGLEGFLNAKLLVAALKRAGANPTRAKIMAALEGGFDLGGFTVRFGPDNRNGSHFVEMSVIGPAGRILR
jgi:ABC-type branched-subunit amino acid transport system substrate-binding protein